MSVRKAREIEPRRGRAHAHRPRQTMRDRDPHVRRSELRNHGTVTVFHQAVDDRLRVHHHIERVRSQREQMMRLDELEAFVHQRRGIDRDFGPIDQVGCLSACSTVTLRIASSGQVRNGPPEAVSTMRRTSSRRPAPSAWKIALCSESTGSTVAPAAAARRMNSAPAQTRHSLLASATVAPRSAAASVGLRLVAPVIAAITQSAGRCAASTTAVGAGRGLDAGAGKLGFEFAVSIRIGNCGKARAEFAREKRQRLGVAMRGYGFDAIATGFLPEQIDGARPDRAGGTEQRHRARYRRQFHPRQRLFLFHRATTIPASRGRRSSSRTNETDEKSGNGGDEEAVEAIHEAPVAGNEVACVLCPKAPLDGKLNQVAGLRQDGQQQPHNAYNPQPADTARIGDPDACDNPPNEPP